MLLSVKTNIKKNMPKFENKAMKKEIKSKIYFMLRLPNMQKILKFYKILTNEYKNIDGWDSFTNYMEQEYFNKDDYLIWYRSPTIPSWIPYTNNNTESFHSLLKRNYTQFLKLNLPQLMAKLKELVEEHLLLKSFEVRPFTTDLRTCKTLFKYLEKYIKKEFITKNKNGY
jgi:hypothetical protein